MNFKKFHDTYRINRFAVKEYVLKDKKLHPVAIICPGGAYRRVCSYVEGEPFAKELNKKGISAFVVYYRCKEKAHFPAPQDDLARAIRYVFDKAKEYNLDMGNYSIWGSSAGGHLVASFGTEIMGYSRYHLPKPSALVLTYPVITMGELTHKESRRFHIGENPTEAMIAHTSVERHVTESYPRTFIWCGDADKSVPPENSDMLVKELKSHSIPHKFLKFEGIGHGVGLGIGYICESWLDEAVKFWLE